MFTAIAAGQFDDVIANNSITAARETVMDFSHPIFGSGLRIMLPLGAGGTRSLLGALFTRDLMLALLAAEALLRDFVVGQLDAVAFDRPVLAFYMRNEGAAHGRLMPRNFKPENCGVALPTGSPLTEEINRALLALRESGRYDGLRTRWFGARP